MLEGFKSFYLKFRKKYFDKRLPWTAAIKKVRKIVKWRNLIVYSCIKFKSKVQVSLHAGLKLDEKNLNHFELKKNPSDLKTNALKIINWIIIN